MILKNFVVCLTLCTAFASTSEKLRAQFESEFPGSVQWLVEWAEEERKIDYYRDLIEGRVPVPQGFKPLRSVDISAFTHYLYDPHTPDVIAQVVTKAMIRGIFVSTLPLPTLVQRIVQFRIDLISVPEKAFDAIANDDPPEKILAMIQQSQEPRYATIQRTRAWMGIWRKFCIDELRSGKSPLAEPPCFHDAISGLWVLSKTSTNAFLRLNLLNLIRFRDAGIPMRSENTQTQKSS